MSYLFDLLTAFNHWMDSFTGSAMGIGILFTNSVLESFISPIPPDSFLVAMSLFEPRYTMLYASLTVIGSVLGAIVGHWLGRRWGRQIILTMFGQKRMTQVAELFHKYGVWAVVVAGITPLFPFKVAVVAAGMCEMKMRPFIIAAFVGRGARYLTTGLMLYMFGSQVVVFLETPWGTMLIISVTVAMIIASIACIFIQRRNGNGKKPKMESINESVQPVGIADVD